MLTEHRFIGSNGHRNDAKNDEVMSNNADSAVMKEEEGRMVVINVYCPMYDTARDPKGEGLSRLDFKLKFYSVLETRCTALEKAGM